MVKSSTVKFLYHSACLISTIGLFCYCGWRFIQNKSNSLVDFRSYNQEGKDIYPSFSICFFSYWEPSGNLNPGRNGFYNVDILKSQFGIDDLHSYIHFLEGRIWNETISNVNYDDVTMNLEDYLYAVGVSLNTIDSTAKYAWQNNESRYYNSSNTQMVKFPFFTSMRLPLQKCFTIDFSSKPFSEDKNQKITYIHLETKNWKSLGVNSRYFIHYPGQLLRAVQLDYEFNGTGIVAGKLHSKFLWIHIMEVIRRRNTFKTTCNTNSHKDFDSIAASLIGQAKCKPPHWTNPDFPVCNNKESIEKFNIKKDFPDTKFLSSYDKPCDQVQTATFTIQEIDRKEYENNPDNNGSLGIIFNSPDYREIKHIQDFNFESLIGNIGGYIGLFLGFAFWQIPDVINIIKHKCCQTSSN